MLTHHVGDSLLISNSSSAACSLRRGSMVLVPQDDAPSGALLEASTIDELWHDYTSILIDQPISVEALKSLGREYPNRWREIPNIPELMERVPWMLWDDN